MKKGVYVLQFVLIFFLLSCGVTDFEIPAKTSKTRLIPEKYQYKYRKEEPDTALLVFLRDRVIHFLKPHRNINCVYLFEEKDIISERIKIQRSKYKGQEHLQTFPLKNKYRKQYLVGCVKPNEKLEMYIPLNRQKEKKVILGFGYNVSPPKNKSWYNQEIFLIKEEIIIKKNKPQYYRWGYVGANRFYPIYPNNL